MENILKSKTYVVKTIEEAQELAVKEMGLGLEELTFDIIEEKRGFLGFGKSVTVEVKTNVDGVERGKEYIQNVLDGNNIKGFIETKVRADLVQYNVEAGELNGYLIGRNGRNLMALQTLVSIVVNNYFNPEDTKNILIDIGDYKNRRKRQLERLAVDVGKQVSRSKQPATLDNLNAYERKIVHAKLATWKDVKTHSEGVGADRKLVVSPK